MRRSAILLLLFCFVMIGGTCGNPPIDGPCSHSVNANDLGFTLTVPDSFDCSSAPANANLSLNLRFVNGDGDGITILVGPPGNSVQNSDQSTLGIEDLGDMTNQHGVTLSREKLNISILNTIEYNAELQLSNGKILGILIADIGANNAGLLDTFNTILDSVELTGG